MGNGDDSLIYESADRHHRTGIEMGNGDDTVTVLIQGTTSGAITINTGNGHDDVTLEMAADSWIQTFFDVTTGHGNDSVLVRANNDGWIPLLGSQYPSSSIIDTEQGNDSVQFEGDFETAFGGDVSVFLGDGDDTLFGDPEFHSPCSAYILVGGGKGEDTVVNSPYFTLYLLYSFE